MTGVSKTSLLNFVVFARFLALIAKVWQANDHRKIVSSQAGGETYRAIFLGRKTYYKVPPSKPSFGRLRKCDLSGLCPLPVRRMTLREQRGGNRITSGGSKTVFGEGLFDIQRSCRTKYTTVIVIHYGGSKTLRRQQKNIMAGSLKHLVFQGKIHRKSPRIAKSFYDMFSPPLSPPFFFSLKNASTDHEPVQNYTAPILWTPGIFRLFLLEKNLVPINFLVFRGGVEVPILFLWTWGFF